MLARSCSVAVLSLSVLTWICSLPVAAAPLRSPVAAAHQQGADAPAKESRTPAVVLGTKEERVAKATENYTNNRPVEAALGFEGLWKDYPAESDFLFNAAAARFAARHYAHAIAYTREYLAVKTLAPSDRKEAENQLTDALKQTVAVSVKVLVQGDAPSPVTLTAEHLARESGDVRPLLIFEVTPGVTTELQLDPGVWSLRAQAAEFTGDERRVQLAAGRPSSAEVWLRPQVKSVVPGPAPQGPKPPPEVPAGTVRGMKLGFGIGGGVIAAAGTATLIAGAVGVGDQKDCAHEQGQSDCVNAFARGLVIRDAGTLGLGLGLGLVAGGLPWLSTRARLRRNVWIGEAVVGGLGFITGLILMPSAVKSFRQDNTTAVSDWASHYDKYHQSVGHAASTTLVGFGAGALLSAAVGLIVQHRALHGVRVSAAVGAGQAGAVVVGRF